MQLAVDELKTEVALRTDEAAQAKETATVASARVRTLEGTNVDLSSKLKQFEAMLEYTIKGTSRGSAEGERVTALEKLAADAATEANMAQAAAAAAQAKGYCRGRSGEALRRNVCRAGASSDGTGED